MSAGMRYQPQGRAKIQKGGLADLLVASVTASQYQSGVLEQPIKLSSGVSRAVTQHGIAFQGSAVNGNIDFGVPAGLGSIITPGTAFSIYMRVFVSVLGQRQGLISDHHSGGSGDSAMVEITAANEWRFNVNAPSAFNIVAAGVTLGWHDVLAVHTPGQGTRLYVDGAQVGSAGFTSGLNAGSSLRLGALGTYTTGLGFRGRIPVCHIFRADVSEQRFELAANPWQVYAAPEEEYEIAAAGGGGSEGIALPQGVAASSFAGIASASGAASTSALGAQSVASVGTAAASGAASASPVGVAASTATSSATASGGASKTVSGAQSAAVVGPALASAGAKAVCLGASAAASVGVVTATGAGSGSALPAGVAASSAVGILAATGGGRAAPTGASATAAINQVAASGSASLSGDAFAVGVASALSVGSVVAAAGASTATPGVSAFALVGNVSASNAIYIGEVSLLRTINFDGGTNRVAFGGGTNRVNF